MKGSLNLENVCRKIFHFIAERCRNGEPFFFFFCRNFTWEFADVPDSCPPFEDDGEKLLLQRRKTNYGAKRQAFRHHRVHSLGSPQDVADEVRR